MPDYIPNTSRQDVLRVIERDFPAEDRDEIVKVLDRFGPDAHRVKLAILKLAGGETDKLRQQIELAELDFRDVLAPAEYPGQLRIGFVGFDRMEPHKLEQLKNDDWNQYYEWLTTQE